jgi:putative CocE/NonD family hydrolase
MGFMSIWHTMQTAHHLLGRPRGYNPDAFNNNLLWEYMRHDLDSEYWRASSAQWEKITVPVYSAGNWTSFALHLRGNTEAFMCAASKNKKLRIHSGTHFHAFYSEEGRMDQLRWFDHWLKGLDTGIMDDPPVKLEIRTGGGKGRYDFRFENEWPIARTQWTKMYLEIAPSNGIDGRLAPAPPASSNKITYAAGGGSVAVHGHGGAGKSGASFETAAMESETEITGPLVLLLWVSSTSEDMDIYATLRNIGPDGKDVFEIGSQGQPVPLTKGWLRASQRKLDADRSLPYRPYHTHDERRWLKAKEPVECQVEIWPTSIVLQKGHKLRLDIQPCDGIGSAPYTHYQADYNLGAENAIHAGGDKASYLLVPVIPPKTSR